MGECEEEGQDRRRRGQDETPRLPKSEAFPRHPHGDDRQRDARDGDRVDPSGVEPARELLPDHEDDRQRDHEEHGHAHGRHREVGRLVVTPIRFSLEPDRVPGSDGARDGREEPDEEVETDPGRQDRGLDSDVQDQDGIQEERRGADEAVPVGVSRERQLEETLLGRPRGLGRRHGPAGLRLPGGRPERLGQGQRRLSRRRLAGHDYACPHLRLGGLTKTNRVRLHKGYVEKYQT